MTYFPFYLEKGALICFPKICLDFKAIKIMCKKATGYILPCSENMLKNNKFIISVSSSNEEAIKLRENSYRMFCEKIEEIKNVKFIDYCLTNNINYDLSKFFGFIVKNEIKHFKKFYFTIVNSVKDSLFLIIDLRKDYYPSNKYFKIENYNFDSAKFKIGKNEIIYECNDFLPVVLVEKEIDCIEVMRKNLKK